MGANLHGIVVAEQQVAVGVEKHGDPVGDEVTDVGRLVVNGEGLVAVGPDLVLKVLFGRPVLVVAWVAEGDADDVDAECLEFAVEVAVPATLGGSTRGSR